MYFLVSFKQANLLLFFYYYCLYSTVLKQIFDNRDESQHSNQNNAVINKFIWEKDVMNFPAFFLYDRI